MQPQSSTLFNLSLFLLPTLAISSLLLLAAVVLLVSSYRKTRREVRELKSSFRKELLRARMEAQELCCHAIAREIHDNVNQSLCLARLQMQSVVSQPIHDSKVLAAAANSKELLTKAIKDLRVLSHNLDSNLITQQGLEKTLQNLTEHISSTTGIEARVTVTGLPWSIMATKELSILRIAQEALLNAVKHAVASKINVDIQYKPDNLVVSIADNGIGFSSQKSAPDRGIGIMGMHERAELLMASLDINTKREAGTEIVLTINRNL